MDKITYLDDIVDEMSKELGVDRKEIEEICKLNIKYIHKLTKTPDVISIFLPKLGVLHFNAKRAKYSYKNSNAYRRYLDVIGSQIDMVDEVTADEKDLVHSRNSYYTIFRKFFYKDREARKKSKKADIYKKLETKQNNLNK